MKFATVFTLRTLVFMGGLTLALHFGALGLVGGSMVLVLLTPPVPR